jgi:hypothetical protein
VRKEDWDSLSDWGQVVRALKLGSEASAVALWVGAMERECQLTPSVSAGAPPSSQVRREGGGEGGR